MTNLDIEYAYRQLGQAIRINDTDFILESCNELVCFDELTPEEMSRLYQLLAICNLNRQCFLKSYQSIQKSIQLSVDDTNQMILEIIKARIME